MIPWDVVEAKIIGEHLIAVTFADGLQGKVYMGRLINSQYAGVFNACVIRACFNRCTLSTARLFGPARSIFRPM